MKVKVGGMGTLNELTIAHDEGRVTGCLTGTGGVADEAERLLERCLQALDKSVED
ncbi:MAG TPA: hypothetical protein VF297_16360 [Pyrinomonadaceae bacterium]